MLPRLLLFLAALPAIAAAQPLSSLVEEALQRNHEILAAQKRYESLRQRPAQANALPDPTVSVGYTSNGPPWPGAGIGSNPTSNIGVMLSQDVPFPGKRGLRGGIAGKEAEAAFQDYLAVRLSVISRVSQAYHELHHATVSITSIRRDQDLLRDILRITESRYAVGRAAQQDIFKAQTQLAVFEAQLERFQQERTSKQIEIDALLNRPQDTAVDVPDEMAPSPIPATLDRMLAAARERSPQLGRDARQIQRSELATNLARKDALPDYTLSGGYFNQGTMPPMWQVRVDVKVPFWHKQPAEVAEQVAAASEARHTYTADQTELEARIREEYSVAETAGKLIKLYDTAVVPGAKLALESSTASYETGKLDFLAVFSNFMSVVDYELMYHEQIMQLHVALARLEELTGGPLQ
jgi:cobalt-zinc-cadmium efflux system outer membrane protein